MTSLRRGCLVLAISVAVSAAQASAQEFQVLPRSQGARALLNTTQMSEVQLATFDLFERAVEHLFHDFNDGLGTLRSDRGTGPAFVDWHLRATRDSVLRVRYWSAHYSPEHHQTLSDICQGVKGLAISLRTFGRQRVENQEFRGFSLVLFPADNTGPGTFEYRTDRPLAFLDPAEVVECGAETLGLPSAEEVEKKLGLGSQGDAGLEKDGEVQTDGAPMPPEKKKFLERTDAAVQRMCQVQICRLRGSEGQIFTEARATYVGDTLTFTFDTPHRHSSTLCREFPKLVDVFTNRELIGNVQDIETKPSFYEHIHVRAVYDGEGGSTTVVSSAEPEACNE